MLHLNVDSLGSYIAELNAHSPKLSAGSNIGIEFRYQEGHVAPINTTCISWRLNFKTFALSPAVYKFVFLVLQFGPQNFRKSLNCPKSCLESVLRDLRLQIFHCLWLTPTTGGVDKYENTLKKCLISHTHDMFAFRLCLIKLALDCDSYGSLMFSSFSERQTALNWSLWEVLIEKDCCQQ